MGYPGKLSGTTSKRHDRKLLILLSTEKWSRSLEENTLIALNVRSNFSAKNAIICGKQRTINLAPQAVLIMVPV
jgi:hypothetical protein